MNAVANRHPADRLADVRSEIKRLMAEEEQLRAYLLEHPQDRTGEEHIAVISSQSRKRVDLRGLADEMRAAHEQTVRDIGDELVGLMGGDARYEK